MANATGACALLLLLLQAYFTVKYFLNVRALVKGEGCGRFAQLPEQRLQVRMAYLRNRFADHAPCPPRHHLELRGD